MKKLLVFLSVFIASAFCAAADAPAQPATPVSVADKPAVAPAAPAAQPAPAAVAPAQPAAQPAPAVAQPAPAVPAQEEEPGVMFCIARGVCNITTGFLEIPRCMIYDNGFMPIFGLIVGIPEGACLTVARMLCGVYDLVSFGTSGNVCHGKVFPNTVFQSKWLYQSK